MFDTQIAAGFAGMGAQSSYDSLLGEMLGVRVAKSASFTRWDAARCQPSSSPTRARTSCTCSSWPSSSSAAWPRSGASSGRARSASRSRARSDERDPEAIFERLPRVRGLSATARAVARELVQWREQIAARQDRPVQSVLGDAALMEIAKRKPGSHRELEQIRGAGAANLRRRGEELLDVVERARELPAESPARTRAAPTPRPEDAPLIALGEALLRARAREAGLAYELLAARADLQAIVAAWRAGEGEADVRTLRGWRRELAGGELLALLDGSWHCRCSGVR